MRMTALCALLLGLVIFAPVARAQDEEAEESLVKAFVSGEDREERVRAGLKLSREAPNTLADALEDLVKAKREDDATLLAEIAVKTKPAHIRLLLVYSASKLDGAVAAFGSQIDNDHPWESIRALEALGFLKDPASVATIRQSLRSQNELVGVAAARALARAATKKDGKLLVDALVNQDNEHVRQHLAWAMRDTQGSARSAGGMFARMAGKPGTTGFRAKEALAVLEDDESPVESYKVKLDTAKDFFGKRAGKKLPPVNGPDEYAGDIKKALEGLQRQCPDWYHMVCSVVSEITLSGNEWIFEFNKGILNLRLRDIINWKDKDGSLRSDLVCYYVVRFTTIMYLKKMGDPGEGHRGWEEGLMAGWWYAMDHTKIAVDEDAYKFLKAILESRPPPW